MSKGARTKERIIQQSAAVFNQNGFEGASMSALMAATGLEKGGLYRHFTNKEELAAAAFDYSWREASRTRAQGIEETANHVDKLKLFIGNFVHRRPSVPGGCPIVNTAVDCDDGNRRLRRKAQTALRQWLQMLEEIVTAGIEIGEVRADVDARKVADIVVSALEGALVISRLERRNETLLAIEDHLYAYLETSVRAPAQR